jgi:putative transposase
MTFYRRNLPHWHPEGKTIFITWRLYRSLPASLLKKTPTARNGCATNASDAGLEDSPGKRFLRFDAALDSARSGPLWLADPELANYAEYPIVRGAELGRYRLHAYVIMPNHVHILLEPRLPLAKITGVIKGVAARDANATLGGGDYRLK